MNRIWYITIGMIAIATGCSPAAPTLTPTALVPTPTVAAPAPPVPTLNPDRLLLESNQGYGVSLFFNLQPPRVTFYEPYPSQKTAFFDLDADNGNPSNLSFSPGNQTAVAWGTPYVLYAVNTQPEHNRPDSPSIGGTLLLSPDRRKLAFFLCNEFGGRGQWCDHPRLWLFDILAGVSTLADFGDEGLLYVSELHFSDNSHTLTGESCLQYANAYFGYCGMSAIMTWDAASGELLDQTPPKSTGRV
jgi:hypothetical protein